MDVFMYLQDLDSENSCDSLTNAHHSSFNRALWTQHRMPYTLDSIFVIVVQSKKRSFLTIKKMFTFEMFI